MQTEPTLVVGSGRICYILVSPRFCGRGWFESEFESELPHELKIGATQFKSSAKYHCGDTATADCGECSFHANWEMPLLCDITPNRTQSVQIRSDSSIMLGVIVRMAVQRAKKLAEVFPAVLILGARQCGKTTLVRSFFDGSYFDLERPSDRAVFAPDIELALSKLPEPLVLDEAQTLPELFPVLRSVIDDSRARNGRFYLLGSVSPELMRNASESLAGRVGTLELTPFVFPELSDQKISLDDFWLRGGFPEAILAADVDTGMLWLEQYIQTLTNRDFVQMGLAASSMSMTRFLGMVASMHGGLLNSSSLGNALGISYHTVNRYLDIAEGHFIVRRLQPWHSNMGKRLVKSPKVYIRDSGILNSLLGIHSAEQQFISPKRGEAWEGMLIEQIITLEQLKNPGSKFWFYRTAAGSEIDLIVDKGSERIGFEFKTALSANLGDASGLMNGIKDKVISKGAVVHAGQHRYPLNENVESIPAEILLSELAS